MADLFFLMSYLMDFWFNKLANTVLFFVQSMIVEGVVPFLLEADQ
jgi:hypothetical protein